MGRVWNIIGTLSRIIIETDNKLRSPSATWPGEYGEAERGCHNNFDITQPTHPSPFGYSPIARAMRKKAAMDFTYIHLILVKTAQEITAVFSFSTT
jgi:hypothetical protein